MSLKMKEEWEEMFGRETYQRLKSELGEKFSDFIKYMTTPPEKRKENLDYQLKVNGLLEGKNGKYYDAQEWTKMAGRELSRLIPRRTVAAKKVQELTFEEKDVEPIIFEKKKKVQEKKAETEPTIGTPFGDITLKINKKMSAEEIEKTVNKKTLFEQNMYDGIIFGAEFRGKNYDLTDEKIQKTFSDLLSARPPGVRYTVKKIRTE